MKRLLIVAHAPSPNTQRLRAAAENGARHPDIDSVDVVVRTPQETTPEDILGCDALIIGTTENLGYMAGLTKDLFDRCYYPCLDLTQGLPFAYYIRAGHDGTGTRRALDTIATGLRWRQVQEPVICRGEYSDAFEENVSELALTIAASLDAGLY